MKKIKKIDILNILVLIISFLIIYFILTRFTYLFGATKDWNSQHYLIPEYFRNLFYETHDLFPDFAFNIGAGQNIYNLSYYGLLNPIILISYLLPFISMRNYIIISSIILLIISTILIYFFIKDKYNSKIAFISSFIFLMSTPLIFHSHRHIMFVNYMPFLILGFIGVDKYFKNKNKILLTISVFLMILMSYYYSVCGIVSIIIYGIYVYLKINNKIKIKEFFKDGIKFLLPIIIGVLLSCILIVPTLYALMNGRTSSESINILELFIPDLDLSNLLYSSYSLGLSSIALFGLVNNIFTHKKENIFLSIILTIIVFIPICPYILNGGLYTEAKVFIPLLPLFIILISNSINDILNKNNIKKEIMITIIISCILLLSYRIYLFNFILELSIMLITIYLVNKNKKLRYFYYLLLPLLFIMSICFNLGEEYVKEEENIIEEENEDKVLEILENDNSFYRINIYNKNLNNVNKIYDLNYYTASIYSSSSSTNLKDFYYERIGNEVIFRTYGMMSGTNNIFYNIYMGNKYVISDNFDSFLYERASSGVYKSDYVLPLGYASSKIMSEEDYDELDYPDNIYAYVNYIIVNQDIESNYESKIEEIELDYDIVSSEIELDKDNIEFDLEKRTTIKLDINNDLTDKILIISFDMNYQESCGVGDTTITINGIKNKLSCENWKYNNDNYTFEYVLSDVDLDSLSIVMSKGKYNINNIHFYTMNYSDIYSIVDDIDEFIIDKDKTIGDKIYGTIDVSSDSYFRLSIPYDEGFTVYVDNKEVEIEKIDKDFIGFSISKGEHSIEIIYNSPYKNIGIILSVIGLILLILEGGLYVNDYRNNRRIN